CFGGRQLQAFADVRSACRLSAELEAIYAGYGSPAGEGESNHDGDPQRWLPSALDCRAAHLLDPTAAIKRVLEAIGDRLTEQIHRVEQARLPGSVSAHQKGEVRQR